MSIRRDPRSPFWQYNFQIRGHRFFGSTKKTTRREAEAVERAERERAKAQIAQAEAARASLRLDDVAGRYWSEHAQHLAGAANIWTLLGFVLEFLGKDKIITEIVDDDVARMVAWRRGHESKSHEATLISPHTVNHTTETLRKLFTRAKLWGVRFQNEPKWSQHLLQVPSERVRELSDDEADKLDAAMREDYVPFFALARASGLRLNECLLRWSEVDWSARCPPRSVRLARLAVEARSEPQGRALAHYFGPDLALRRNRRGRVIMQGGWVCPAKPYFETNSHAPSSRYPTL